jgi:membrane associated rhomboid family serine protease
MNPIWIIIAINFLLFIATCVNRELILILGLAPINFLSQPWTIVTNMFIHSGFWHLFGNMLILFFFGRALTMMVGENKFLLVYFVGGIVGNLLYLLLGEPLSIAIGASGAVYAVAGALVVMRPSTRVLLYFFIPMPLWIVVLVFFVIWSFIPGVAWQAHIGGLVVGLIAGYFFRKRKRY